MTHDPNKNLTFGQALEALKQGRNIARSGWNGKNMYLFLRKGILDGPALGFKENQHINADHPSTMDGISFGLFISGKSGTETVLPSVCMKTATGNKLVGWLASQTDMFAEDWCILD